MVWQNISTLEIYTLNIIDGDGVKESFQQKIPKNNESKLFVMSYRKSSLPLREEEVFSISVKFITGSGEIIFVPQST